MSEDSDRFELGALANSFTAPTPIDLEGFSAKEVRDFLERMLRIRFAEEEIAKLVENGSARTPCHLGIGQEAVAVGVAHCLTAADRVFGGHRSHSQYLALGGSVYRLLAEVLGKQDGASRGMGGSMHLFGRELGFYGSVPLVAATIPMAVGAAIAAQMDGGDAVGVAFFGDGATEEGVFHESMNLASAFNYPVLFICENNLFASHLHISLRQPGNRIARYGEMHRVSSETVDGNDVIATARATQALLGRVRTGNGPALLEAITYRHRGHVGPKDDIDVGVARCLEDIKAWKRRDPIDRLVKALTEAAMITQEDLDALTWRLREEIHSASAQAQAADYPPVSALLDTVYARTPE